jgi:hypothetical protein
MQRRYIPGAVVQIRLGGDQGQDRHGACLYGDANGPGAAYAMMAVEYAPTSDHVAYSDHQKVTFWFEFEGLRPYGEVDKTATTIEVRLQEAGWTLAPAIPDYPETGSSIGDLFDTGMPEYLGRPEADFPAEPNVCGYNAASGFKVVVEKLGTEPIFSEDEIEELHALTRELGEIVYDRRLAPDESE